MERVYERALEDRAKQLSDFLSIAAHELNIPVTIMKGYSQTLGRHMKELSQDTIDDILRSIEGSSDRLERLVRELLDVSRIETGRLAMEMRKTDIEELLQRAVREIEMRGSRNLFRLDIAPGLHWINGEPEKLNQVLLILLENASRFSPASSLVEIRAEVREGEAVVAVMDRGMGVPEDDRVRIFEPFSQVEDPDHHSLSGLGLGLYIAQEIIQGHGGRVWHEEREGGGSIFRFSVPMAE